MSKTRLIDFGICMSAITVFWLFPEFKDNAIMSLGVYQISTLAMIIFITTMLKFADKNIQQILISSQCSLDALRSTGLLDTDIRFRDTMIYAAIKQYPNPSMMYLYADLILDVVKTLLIGFLLSYWVAIVSLFSHVAGWIIYQRCISMHKEDNRDAVFLAGVKEAGNRKY